jgi:hypothetical protein
MSISGGLTWMDATLALAQISASVGPKMENESRMGETWGFIWDLYGIYIGFIWDLNGST